MAETNWRDRYNLHSSGKLLLVPFSLDFCRDLEALDLLDFTVPWDAQQNALGKAGCVFIHFEAVHFRVSEQHHRSPYTSYHHEVPRKTVVACSALGRMGYSYCSHIHFKMKRVSWLEQ